MAYKQLDLQKEFAQNLNLRRQDVEVLRQYVETQSHPAVSDVELFLFLHSNYYNMDRAKNTIDCYFDLRSRWPEVFQNRNVGEFSLNEHMKIALYTLLKNRTNEGYGIFFSKLIVTDVSKYDTNQQIKLFMMVAELFVNAVGNLRGFVFVIDLAGVTWEYLPKYGITTVRKLVAYMQTAIPWRLKGIHFINSWGFIDKILFIARPFMMKELHDMIYTHSEIESFYEYVPKKCLPKDYGGDDLTTKELHENYMQTLVENAHFFTQEPENANYQF